MSDQRTILLAAIIGDPTDLVARLAYADRCEEEGDVHRAEFIRGMIDLYEADPEESFPGITRASRRSVVDADPRVRKALDRILGAYHRDVRVHAEVAAWQRAGGTWRRGFVECLSNSLADLFSAQAIQPSFLVSQPISQLVIVDARLLDPSWCTTGSLTDLISSLASRAIEEARRRVIERETITGRDDRQTYLRSFAEVAGAWHLAMLRRVLLDSPASIDGTRAIRWLERLTLDWLREINGLSRLCASRSASRPGSPSSSSSSPERA